MVAAATENDDDGKNTDLIEVLQQISNGAKLEYVAQDQNQQKQQKTEGQLTRSSVSDEFIERKKRKSQYQYVYYIDYAESGQRL